MLGPLMVAPQKELRGRIWVAGIGSQVQGDGLNGMRLGFGVVQLGFQISITKHPKFLEFEMTTLSVQ